MSLPRISIASLMGLIAIVALHIVAFRQVIAYDRELAREFAPMVFALDVAAERTIRSRSRARAFWAGFLATGLVAAVAVTPPVCHPPEGYLQPTGPTSYTFIEQAPASAIWWLFFDYNCFVERWIGPLNGRAAVATIVAFLPWFVVAATGGLIAWLAAGAGRSARSRRSPPATMVHHRGDRAPGIQTPQMMIAVPSPLSFNDGDGRPPT